MNNLLKKSIKEYQKKIALIHQLKEYSDKIRVKSKQAIVLLRRDNAGESGEVILEIENVFKEVNEILKENKDLANQGFYREAVEEYVEAKVFYGFLSKISLKIPDFIVVKLEEIIGGICDFTGELIRKSITIASSENLGQLSDYREAVEDIAQELTVVVLEGRLRHKYDELERNLKRLENIIYDIRIKH